MSTSAVALSNPQHPVRVRDALAAAARDFWFHSWRLALLNVMLSLALLCIAVAAAFSLLALGLVPVLGLPAVSLAHCTVTLARSGELRLSDALDGVRLHWQRGLELGLCATVVVGVGVYAIVFYASTNAATWLPAFVVVYLLAAFTLLQLHLWPLAVILPGERLRPLLARAVASLLRRPGATLRLGLVLLVVNLLGIGAAVMPFLTLTIAYSFLAAAHFALPPATAEEV